MKHTKECERAAKLYDFTVAYYKDQWPDYCQSCHGWGAHISYFDPSPAGVSLGSGRMQDVEICPQCVEKNRCPRCGIFNLGWSDETLETDTCTGCGWNMEQPSGLPEPPECYCWNYCEKCDELLDLMDEGPLCPKCESKPKIDEYLLCPTFCPWCRSVDIEIDGIVEADSGISWEDMVCEGCGKEWRNQYILTAISWRPKDGGDRIYSDEV